MNSNEAFSRRSFRRVLRRRGYGPEAIAFAEGIAQRAAFARSFLGPRLGRRWAPRGYQLGSLESRAQFKCHCDGRNVGKTTEIRILVAWTAFAQPHAQVLLAAQYEAHVTPLANRILADLQAHPDLAENILSVRKQPFLTVQFKNGAEWTAVHAGENGNNFQGQHVDWALVDEAQNMTPQSWSNLIPAVNPGGRLWIYGVPNGFPTRFKDFSLSPRFEQYNWPTRLNPDMTPEALNDLEALYGGKAHPHYIHNVLGQHGAPARAVFPFTPSRLRTGHATFCCAGLPDKVGRLPAVAGLPYYLGCDLGFSEDPSVFSIALEDRNAAHVVGRITLSNVTYPEQQRLIRQLDARFPFHCIALDKGHSGLAVGQNLMALGVDWADKVRFADFGSSTVVHGEFHEPVKRYTKELLTEILIRRALDKQLLFPLDECRDRQYAGHTFAYAPSGRMVYSKGNDHIIDADRCLMLALHAEALEAPSTEAHGLPPLVMGF